MTPLTGQRTEGRVDYDRAFGVLSDATRRRILSLLARDAPRRQSELDLGTSDSEPSVAEAFEIKLHHTHLPRLDESDFVDWDRDSGVVHRGPDFETIRPLVEMVEEYRSTAHDRRT